ncbi:MAG: hypothetical protein IJU23_08850 [Proteobacteria bacterium]|nr:hypothetical protein [Pseudomonadota bacterium]
MKRFIPLLIVIPLFCACQNEQQQFCSDAVTTLCGRCASCGGDFKACGLNHVTSRDECISTLTNVCSAYDANYARSTANTCLTELTRLTCDQLKTEGKPEVCTRFF